MKTSRYSDSQIISILKQAEAGTPVPELCREHGMSSACFYRWYDRYLARGFDGLNDQQPHPGKAWNRIPDHIRKQVHDMALDEPELSPRELARLKPPASKSCSQNRFT